MMRGGRGGDPRAGHRALRRPRAALAGELVVARQHDHADEVDARSATRPAARWPRVVPSAEVRTDGDGADGRPGDEAAGARSGR